MVRGGKFTIGKSKSSRLTLEQRILGYNRQLTKLNTKVDLISAWISKKFGVTFLVEASARVKLKDVSKPLSLLKSTAPLSLNLNPGLKKTKLKRQQTGSENSEASNIMVVSDSDIDEADHDNKATERELADDRAPLEDGEPERERRIPRQRKSKAQRNKTARLQLGANNGQEGKESKEQRPRRTQAPAPDKGRQKHFCNWPNCQFFGNKSHLLEHQRIHTGVKPFRCTWPKCGKSFSRSYDRTKHRRTHTGEKPYVCNWPDCEKSFGQSSTLQEHRRTHTGDRPFKCGFCDYRCAHNSGLTIHMRVHTGERPYKCRVCATTFTTSGNKVQHEKIHRKVTEELMSLVKY